MRVEFCFEGSFSNSNIGPQLYRDPLEKLSTLLNSWHFRLPENGGELSANCQRDAPALNESLSGASKEGLEGDEEGQLEEARASLALSRR